MLVRLRQAATVLLKDIGHHWHPAGSEVEIPDEHFDPAVHEDLAASLAVAPLPPPETASAADPSPDTPVAADSPKET